jgi:hypothetical protein
MIRRRVFGTTMVLAAALLACESVYASPLTAVHIPVQAKLGKTAKAKMVSLNLRNDSAAPIKVKAGDNEMTLAPGKLAAVKVAEGATIIAVEATPSFPAGAVLATVSSSLSQATLALK